MSKIESAMDLKVFEKAYSLSLQVHKLSHKFPPVELYELGKQLRRSSKSICVNIAEGYGKRKGSVSEFKRYLQIAIGSTDETLVWVRYSFDLGYIGQDTYQDWTNGYQEVAKMLHGLHKSWK